MRPASGRMSTDTREPMTRLLRSMTLKDAISSSLDARRALTEVRRCAHRLLLGKFEMQQRDLPPSMASASGAFNKLGVELKTEAFSGQRGLSQLWISQGQSDSGGMESLTLLALPSLSLEAPILSFDLVSFGGKFAVLFLDLSPFRSKHWAPSDARRASAAALQARSKPRAAPDWGVPFFSDHVVLASAHAPLEHTLPIAAEDCLRQMITVLEGASQIAESEGRSWQNEFLAAMRSNKKESRALGMIFGDDWAHEFLEEYLFGPV